MGNLTNAVIAFLVPLPSIVFYLSFLRQFSAPGLVRGSTDSESVHPPPLWAWTWCAHHPFLLANLLFFLNVNVLFWLIGLMQSSNWMIDLYWTVIPVMQVHYYATHPLARYNQWRSAVITVLTWVWSIRLSHNYFRRERWQWGAREDWRFTDLRRQYGKHWWWVSFFAVYLSQQVFLIGVCLPMYAAHSIEKPCNVWDSIAAIVCTCGIVVAYFADTQLYEFVERNKALKVKEKENLDEGLWRYSRHPNYFGEQLWWWGLALFGWNVGHGWTFIGALINSLCLAYVTVLVERRMLKQPHRADAYRLYQKTTSVWIPWFKTSPERAPKDKDT
ncbi:uncharacterized protein C594.04c [Macadamia integrifolia]|uniref:uncharacterized protein C594.04c n=1 Tax=Macadamia integrifolia TaxID=60698 RepID=UPI001C500BBE|nr:uncharacterized protein C594.04c [Macadamia integrifolia]